MTLEKFLITYQDDFVEQKLPIFPQNPHDGDIFVCPNKDDMYYFDEKKETWAKISINYDLELSI